MLVDEPNQAQFIDALSLDDRECISAIPDAEHHDFGFSPTHLNLGTELSPRFCHVHRQESIPSRPVTSFFSPEPDETIAGWFYIRASIQSLKPTPAADFELSSKFTGELQRANKKWERSGH